jgi:hypothetical protein
MSAARAHLSDLNLAAAVCASAICLASRVVDDGSRMSVGILVIPGLEFAAASMATCVGDLASPPSASLVSLGADDHEGTGRAAQAREREPPMVPKSVEVCEGMAIGWT